jgi:alginate O-acetyltransferase complex protein AlgI
MFCFLPIVFVLYFSFKDIAWKNVVLLIASLLFYAWGEPVYVVLMVLSILFNYYAGREIEKEHKKSSLVFAIIINILILGYFKYSGFLIDTINSIFGTSIRNRELALPIGISFYTFQAMSYLIDVYRRNSRAQKSILPFAVYITMFPQLIAGPIVRYEDIEEQLESRLIKGSDFVKGIPWFVKGMFKKIVLANCIGAIHTEVLAMGVGNISAFTAWIGALAYTLQIFNDFSGYSDMAIGLGKIFGFEFPKNFDSPYRSGSVTEFWRRWHISLGTWFREYVYIPLGGNRKGVFRHIINLLIVWALTGLWHGAAWNFVLWGVYYGVLLIFEKYVYSKIQKKIPAVINILVTFIIVIIGWVFFFSNSYTESVSYLGAMFGANGVGYDGTGLFLLLNNLVLMIIAWIPSVTDFEGVKLPKALKWIICIFVFVLTITFLVSESYNPFLYFRF